MQGDYEMVVNDYAKAKSLVSDNAPIVFKKGTIFNDHYLDILKKLKNHVRVIGV